MIINGAYGPYVKGPGRFNNVKVPKEQDPKKITLEEAKKMLDEKPARGGRFGRKAAASKSKTTKIAKATKTTKAKTTKKTTKTTAKKTTRAKKTS